MSMKNAALFLLVGAFTSQAKAQDEPEPAPVAETAAAQLAGRIYLSPMVTYSLTDKGRLTDNGIGGSVAIGKQYDPYFSFEISAQQSKIDPAEVSGVGINTLFFPARGSLYGLVGAAYGKVKNQPGNDSDYGTALFQLGAGWLFKPFSVFGQHVFVRSEALYRLDAHGDRRTGTSTGNGRKAFNDAVFSFGLLLPIGSPPAPVEPPPVEPEPVEVVALAEEPAPEAAPEPAAEAPPAPACTPPQAGQPISLDGCALGDTIVLKGVYFATDKAVLVVDAKFILDGAADALLARPELQVEVGGHTDSDASEPYNQQLSERRAKAVMEYLVGKGIEAARLSSKGYGETAPIADNATADGKALNRRVELKVTGLATTSEAAPPPAEPAAESPPAEAPASASPPPATEAEATPPATTADEAPAPP